MERNCVSADASFYIGFAEELNRIDWLLHFTNLYLFYIGNRVNKEIPTPLSNNDKFLDSVKPIVVDYWQLVKPYFNRSIKHKEDGEYEAIGIAHFLYLQHSLSYLVIDERRAYNFVLRHFPYLKNNLVGSIGFVRDSCNKDKMINNTFGIEILNTIIKEIENGKDIFRIGKKERYTLVKPILSTLEFEDNKYG